MRKRWPALPQSITEQKRPPVQLTGSPLVISDKNTTSYLGPQYKKTGPAADCAIGPSDKSSQKMKVLMILVVPLVAVCVAVRLPRDLETMELSNSIELDPEGSFRLDWDLVDKEVANPEIVLEMKVATSGWFSLRFTSDDLKMGDYFFGAYDQFKPSHSFFLDKHCSSLKNGTGCERPDGPVDDVRNDFKLISLAVDNNSLQILRISRLADTGDVGQDVVIKPGPIMIGWFWSSAITDQNGELTPIEKLGFQDVVLIPETDF